MITTLVTWIIIFYTLFSLGDFFILLYNRICSNKESYNIMDTFTLGICFTTILLSISSLWLPSNHYILFAYIIIGTIHWIFNYSRLKKHIKPVVQFYSSSSFFQKALIVTSFIAVLVYVYIFEHHYDAEYYHYQQIRWNEEFSVVPGLANLEDRFGFNSNYLLLSSIFTFRFLFGDIEALYVLQSLFYVILLIWILIKLFYSNYNIKYIIAFLLSIIIVAIYGFMLTSSCTDIFPILFIFFYSIKTITDSKWIYKQPLLACLLPVVMVTIKLSTAPFCLICLFILYYLFKNKKHKELYLIFILGVLTIASWCIRNIIISGYLVYPIHQIDLFNFDWEVPKATALIHNTHIQTWGKRVFMTDWNTFINTIRHLNFSENWSIIVKFISLILVMVLSTPTLYKTIKKKTDINTLTLYLITIFCLIFGLVSAPDFRFIFGYILAGILLSFAILYDNKNIIFPKSGKYTISLIVLFLCIISAHKFDVATKRIGATFNTPIDFLALYHHRSSKNIGDFKEYNIDGMTIYLSARKMDNRTYDLLPATAEGGIPFGLPSGGLKIQNISTIEPRGKTLQDGFRTKKEFIKVLNTDLDKYKEEYFDHLKRGD